MDRRGSRFTQTIGVVVLLTIVGHAGTEETRHPDWCALKLASTLNYVCGDGNFYLGSANSGLRKSRQVQVAETLSVSHCCEERKGCSIERLQQYCETPPEKKTKGNSRQLCGKKLTDALNVVCGQGNFYGGSSNSGARKTRETPSRLQPVVKHCCYRPIGCSEAELKTYCTKPVTSSLEPPMQSRSQKLCGPKLTHALKVVCGEGNFYGGTLNSGSRKTRHVESSEDRVVERCCFRSIGCSNKELREYCATPPIPGGKETDFEDGTETDVSASFGDSVTLKDTSAETSTWPTVDASPYFIEVTYEAYTGDLFVVS